MSAPTAAPVDELYIRPDLLHPAILRFVASSALDGCTTVETHPNGWSRIAPRWPIGGWSTGEQVLWRVLGSLAGGDLRTAFDRVDARSIKALSTVFETFSEAVA